MKSIFRMGLESCRSDCRWIVSVETLCPGLGHVTGILGSCSVGPMCGWVESEMKNIFRMTLELC